MGLGIIYRKAKQSDREDLYVMAKELATSFDVNKPDFLNVFKLLLGDENVDLIVADKGNKLIGYVFIFHHPAFYANGIISLG
ncbi:hypothetical protein ACQKFO_09705 [Rossellomorea sp. NPDC071047]|uniref:hypothetical protein n=1 Tax=Rossellomorea sp. NPDC071047 TaxID=3390675 RepID=UPI003D03F283